MRAANCSTPCVAEMPATLIIGYGNPLRGDDAVGYLAAERLQQRNQDPEIEIIACHQLTPELVDPISRTRHVIFIDASVEGEAGAISLTPVEAEVAVGLGFTHFTAPAGLLAGAQSLYGKAPKATLICIAGESFEIGDRLSAPVAAALEELCRRDLLHLEDAKSQS